jgi:peptidoglycan endopeptidase LytF
VLLVADAAEEVVVSENEERLLREALAARGTRYRWGGASRGGFDCSGFTRYLFARHYGITLPHSASAQAKLGKKVPREALEPGDLLFFRTYRRGISHVGVYIGDNKFVHAANTRRRVRVDSLSTPYYRNRFVTARRMPEPTQ